MGELEFRPNNIHVYVASCCNLACRYCWNQGGTFGDSDAPLMTEETARKALAFIKAQIAATRPGHMGISVFGGEPLLNPGVVRYLVRELELVRLEGRTDLRVLIFTNGTVVDDELIPLIADRPWIEYHVGLDGPEETHDKYRVDRDGNGTHRLVTANIARLQRRRVFVAAESVITKPYDYIALIEEYDRLGLLFGYVQEEIIPVHGEGGAHRQVESFDIDAWRAQYARFVEYYFDTIVDGAAPLVDPLFTVVKEFVRSSPPPRLACTAGTLQAAIASDGRIHACNQLQIGDAFLLGDVSDGLDEERYGRFVRLLLSEGQIIDSNPACLECPIRCQCRGGCYARNYVETGSIGTIHDPSVCEFRRAKAQIDLAFVTRMLKAFPDYAEDVSRRNYARYFPRLSGAGTA